jgi:ribosomal protein S18 acetylase RimI-like enzyme
VSGNLDLVRYRPAIASDALGIAHLHAESWRVHYRGAYSDAFLDHDVPRDRVAVWTERLHREHPDEYTLVAENNRGIVGFAHTILGDDPRWGALLENLHVAGSLHRSGVGTQLMLRTARVVLNRAPAQGLSLWVLEQNTAAQAFYTALGGTRVERALALAPGGDPARLTGSPSRLRYVWPDPDVLLDGTSALKAVGLAE